jgi:hypothetical protein
MPKISWVFAPSLIWKRGSADASFESRSRTRPSSGWADLSAGNETANFGEEDAAAYVFKPALPAPVRTRKTAVAENKIPVARNDRRSRMRSLLPDV